MRNGPFGSTAARRIRAALQTAAITTVIYATSSGGAALAIDLDIRKIGSALVGGVDGLARGELAKRVFGNNTPIQTIANPQQAIFKTAVPLAQSATDFAKSYVEATGKQGVQALLNAPNPLFFQTVMAIRGLHSAGVIKSQDQCQDHARRIAAGVVLFGGAELGGDLAGVTGKITDNIGSAACGTAFSMSAVQGFKPGDLPTGTWTPSTTTLTDMRIAQERKLNHLQLLIDDVRNRIKNVDDETKDYDITTSTWRKRLDPIQRAFSGMTSDQAFIARVASGEYSMPVAVCVDEVGFRLFILPDMRLIRDDGQVIAYLGVDPSGKSMFIGEPRADLYKRDVYPDVVTRAISVASNGHIVEHLREDNERKRVFRGLCVAEKD